MGLFTKNTLTIDETVDVVTFVAVSSMYSYAARGGLLSAVERKALCEQRIELRGKQASVMHIAKLAANADRIAKIFIADPRLSQEIVDLYTSDSSEATKKSFVANVVAPFVRKDLFSSGVI